jgi:hypothetical protein
MDKLRLASAALVGGAAVHLVFVACSGMDRPGARLDGGTDAFAKTAHDSGTPVSGGTVLTAACDQTRTVMSPTYGLIVGRYADIAVPGLDLRRPPRVAAYVCDPNNPAAASAGVQPDVLSALCMDSHASCSGYVPPMASCAPALQRMSFVSSPGFSYPYFAVSDGHVVIYCGAVENGATVDGGVTTVDSTWRTATVRID